MRLKKKIDYAQSAPRCQHVKLDGSPCFAPALHGHSFCRFHNAARRPDYSLPLVEDPQSLGLALMQIIRGITDGALETRRATAVLYALQIAAQNLPRVVKQQQDTAQAHLAGEQKSLAAHLIEMLDLEPEPGDNDDDSPPPSASPEPASC